MLVTSLHWSTERRFNASIARRLNVSIASRLNAKEVTFLHFKEVKCLYYEEVKCLYCKEVKYRKLAHRFAICGEWVKAQTQNPISNLVESNQIWIVITLFRIDLAQQKEFRLVQKKNQSLKTVITIQIWFDLTRFEIEFSLRTWPRQEFWCDTREAQLRAP